MAPVAAVRPHTGTGQESAQPILQALQQGPGDVTAAEGLPLLSAAPPERATVASPVAQAPLALPGVACPPTTVVAELAQSVALGYYRGILNALADIERQHPEHAAFVHRVRPLAQQFQFEALGQILEHATP